jgi:ComEC/Rec2-related protein
MLLVIALKGFLNKNFSLTSRFWAFLFLLISIMFLIFLFQPWSSFQNKQNFNGPLCGLVIKDASSSLSLTNITIEGKRLSKNLRLSLNNEEKKNLSVKELDFFCIEGQFKIYQTQYGNGLTVDNLRLKQKITLLGDVKSLLTDKITKPIDLQLGENSRILKAIVLGVKDDLTNEDEDIFKKLGLLHLLVASGANIAIIVMFLEKIFALLSFLKNKKVFSYFTNLLLVLFVCLYLLLVGFEGSLTRAFFFFIMMMGSRFVGREIDFLPKIFYASALMLIVFPGLVFTLSFLLSVTAVFAIYFSEKLSDYLSVKSESLRNLILSIIVPTIMFIPTSYFFSEINLLSLLTNLIIAPMVEFIILSGFLFILVTAILNFFGLPGLVNILTQIINYFLDTLSFINEVFYSVFLNIPTMVYYKINAYELIFAISFFVVILFFINKIIFDYKLKSI